MKAIFIDRDGVINKDPGGWTTYSYVTDWKDFFFLPGSLEALKLLNKNNIKVIVISNQAGVSKGYFSKERLDEITSKMLKEINKNGGKVEEAFYCIHKDEDNCSCRKPKAGLLEKASDKYGIDVKGTYFIGDSEADVVAGNRIGCKTVFVLSGKTSREEMERWKERPDYVFTNLLEAVNWLIKKKTRRSNRASRRQKIAGK